MKRWRETWNCLASEPPDGLLDELIAAYSEPQRAYHTVRHLSECFDHLDACPLQRCDPGAIELALWFHDAVYDTRASDNEARSAAWARSALGSLDTTRLDRIEGLVLATRHDGGSGSPDEDLLLDIDLSILGASPTRFHEYEEQVRSEYSWVADEAYARARARILGTFEERPFLYRTAYFRDRLEAQARRNLRRSLAALSAG